jgi:chromosome partitioning protein
LTSAETAKFAGIEESYLRKLMATDRVPTPNVDADKKRLFSLDQLNEVRAILEKGARGSSAKYLRRRTENDPLQVISVMNFKGGSGKTTTAIHLAQYLALRGYRVLAVDLDPQASLTAMLGYQPETQIGPDETLMGAITYLGTPKETKEIILSTYIPGLHLIPAGLELMEFEHETPHHLALNKGADKKFFLRVGEAIDQVDAAYDVVIFDCPPQLGYLTLSAMAAATSTLITIHPQMLDVMSMSQFLEMAANLLEVIKAAGASTKSKWMRYLLTRYEPSDIPQQQMFGFLKSLFGDRVMNATMLKSTMIADAGLTKKTLYEIDRSKVSRDTYGRAITAVDAVNAEIESLIRSAWGRQP